jgi:hypothetical protein
MPPTGDLGIPLDRHLAPVGQTAAVDLRHDAARAARSSSANASCHGRPSSRSIAAVITASDRGGTRSWSCDNTVTYSAGRMSAREPRNWQTLIGNPSRRIAMR